MLIVYDIILIFIAIITFPYFFFRKKIHKGIWQRLGFRKINVSRSDRRIWIHAVSVGEVLAIKGLVEKMNSVFSECNVVCSTVTKTGFELAKNELKEKADVIYAPLDFPWVVKKYIKAIDPIMYISAETEIWPNLYYHLHKKNIPIIQVNGRISDKSYKGYLRYKFFTKRILDKVSLFCMQTDMDALRIISLGADQHKVKVIGNLKFDSLPESIDITKGNIGFYDDDFLLIAGSTHSGEEEIIANIFMKLKPDFPRLNLIVAPRHIERADEVIKKLEAMSLRTIKFSEIKKDESAENKVVVVDTIGDLRSLYSLASVVFVGKSLTAKGGQNMIEPIFFGKPTFVGPNTDNFRNIVSMLKDNEVLFEIKDKEELLNGIKNIISTNDGSKKYSNKLKKVVSRLRGATDRTIKMLEQFIY